jgi:hypothetical protein
LVSKVEFGENIFIVPIAHINYMCWSGVGSILINFQTGHNLIIGNNPEDAIEIDPRMIGNLRRCFDTLVSDMELYNEVYSEEE